MANPKFLLVTLASLCCLFGAISSSYLPSYLSAKFYASKTHYELARADFGGFLQHLYNQQVKELSDSDLHPRQCTPSQLSLVLRHGSRYPDIDDMDAMTKLNNKIQNIDLVEKFQSLKHWDHSYKQADEEKLSLTGADEHRNIAKRFMKAFPNLFNSSCQHDSMKKYKIASSSRDRSIDSAVGFTEGVMTELGIAKENIRSIVELRNDLLRFYDDCSKYINEVDDNDAAEIEADTFHVGKEILEAAKLLSQRVSKSGDSGLFNGDDLDTIWTICGFELALNRTGDGREWCDTLTVSDTQVLEYGYDLKSYWTKGYGNKINYEQACPLLTDIMSNFKGAISNKRSTGVSAYFGHSQTVASLQALLGLFKDDQPLRASNYKDNRVRKLRTSLAVPFAGNVGLVMYECKAGTQTTATDWPDNLDDTMIQLIVNEHVVKFPFTSKSAVSLADFENHYNKYVNECNFDKLCEN